MIRTVILGQRKTPEIRLLHMPMAVLLSIHGTGFSLQLDDIMLQAGLLRLREDAGKLDRASAAFCAVSIAGELTVTSGHVPATVEELGSIGASVFECIGVKALANSIASAVSAPRGLCPHRPGAFHPRTLVNLVNVVVAVHAAAQGADRHIATDGFPDLNGFFFHELPVIHRVLLEAMAVAAKHGFESWKP